MRSPRFASLASLILAATLAGCASDSVKDSDNPELIYNAAVKFIDREHYIEAGEHLNEIRHRFPQSRFAALAELRQGDMEFKQENYIEAAASYKVFVELYPKHPEADYAQYQRALSYYNDTPDLAARDQTPAKDAIDAAEQLIARYPNSPYASKAKKLIVDARRKLAEKEAYVARFYEKRGAKDAALKRWTGLLHDFEDLKSDEASKALFAEATAQSEKLTAPK